MKKTIFALAVFSALGLGAAQAATVGAEGIINFTGTINGDSCVLHSNGAGSAGGGMLSYDMGAVSVHSLGTADAPATSATNGVTTLPIAMNLQLECVSGTSVDLELTPTIASGKGIGVTGGANGVQIMLVQSGTAVDFTNGSANVAVPLSNGKAALDLTAYYTLQDGVDTADVVPGTANGTVNYVLKYD